MKTRYVWKPASRVSPKLNAEACGRRLDAVRREHGVLTPQHVVEDAQDPESPYHEYFIWDDKRAGEQYRFAQARLLIASIRIVKAHNEPQRVWLNVREEGRNLYEPKEKVISSPDLKDQVRASCLSRALAALRCVEEIEGVSHLCSSLEAIIADLNDASEAV